MMPASPRGTERCLVRRGRVWPVGRWDAPRGARVALAAMTLALLLVGANLATPIYPVLQARLGLSPLDVTVAFAAYVLALVAGLLVLGHWSDHLGRRSTLLPAVIVGLAGDAVFARVDSVSGLCAGRALQGVAVALATGASAAALRELLPDRPDWAPRLTLLASIGGVAAGPVLGGLLSELPGTRTTPFVAHAVALTVLLAALSVLRGRRPVAAPPAPGRRGGRGLGAGGRWRRLAPRRPGVAAPARAPFLLAGCVGFVSYAVFGFYLCLAPSYASALLHTDSRALTGGLAALLLLASAATQLLAPRVERPAVLVAGLLGLAAGVALVAAAGPLHQPALLVVGSLVGGVGQGLAFRLVYTAVSRRLTQAAQAGTVSALYVVAYLGSVAPVVGLGVVSTRWGVEVAVALFGAVTVLACAAVSVVALRQGGAVDRAACTP